MVVKSVGWSRIALSLLLVDVIACSLRSQTVLPAQGKRIQQLSFVLDGGSIVAIDDNCVCIWNIKTKQRSELLSVDKLESLWCLGASSDSHYLAAGITRRVGARRNQAIGSVTVIDMLTGKQVANRLITNRQTNKGVYAVRSVSFSPDGRWLAAASDAFPFNDGLMTVMDSKTWSVVGQSHVREGIIRSHCFSRDSKRILAVNDNLSKDQGELLSFDVKELVPVTILTQSNGSFNCVACSPIADLFACGGERGRRGPASIRKADGLLFVGGYDSKEQPRELEGHEGSVLALAFPGRGDLLAAGDASGKLTIWDLNLKRPPVTVDAHEKLINSVSFSPNGDAIATGANDGKIKIWSVNQIVK